MGERSVAPRRLNTILLGGFAALALVIAAVGIGVFVANVLTIDRMSALQSRKVKTISTADDDVELSPEEEALLDQASGKVLLFQLAGPMIFGVAKAIAREHNAIGNCQAVVFDLSEVLEMCSCSSSMNRCLAARTSGRVPDKVLTGSINSAGV